MAILGIGTDIVEVARIKRMLDDKRELFLSRVYTANEIAYCTARARPEQHFAARFAAKEAFLKALGTGWAQGAGFTDAEVANDPQGRPALAITGRAKELLDGLGPSFLWVSLSHTNDYATATVVIESRT
ncbi:MAG: holo-ACP synthase [Planctomycetes bacterium]|nr:holo-ACP synthase [Planctomycetota bacterium]